MTLALKKAGVVEGDILYSHVALGALGIAQGCRSPDEICALIVEGVRAALGPSGTFVVPTFSYSFADGDSYDPATSPSTVGPFTEYFRACPGVIRSNDPMFSVAAQGPMAEELLYNLPRTSFGPDCVYDRMLARNAIIANFGLTIEYLTFLHYVEVKREVDYRYSKMFDGFLKVDGKWQPLSWEYHVRVYVDNTFPDLRKFRKKARKEGSLSNVELGRGSVEAMRCYDIDVSVSSKLNRDPWYFIWGPEFDVSAARRTE